MTTTSIKTKIVRSCCSDAISDLTLVINNADKTKFDLDEGISYADYNMLRHSLKSADYGKKWWFEASSFCRPIAMLPIHQAGLIIVERKDNIIIDVTPTQFD